MNGGCGEDGGNEVRARNHQILKGEKTPEETERKEREQPFLIKEEGETFLELWAGCWR